AFEGVVDPALVIADAAVVLPRDHVGRVARVDGDLFLRLPAEGTLLVHPDVVELAGEDVGAAEGVDHDAAREIALCGGPADGAGERAFPEPGVQPGLHHPAGEALLVRLRSHFAQGPPASLRAGDVRVGDDG